MINHKDLYLTTFTGGTSGTFLNVLIYSWLEDLDLSKELFDDYATAHELEGRYVFTNHVNGSLNKETHQHSSMSQAAEFIEAIDTRKALVVRQHPPLNFSIIEKNFPNYQHFHIYFDSDDAELIIFNCHTKPPPHNNIVDKDSMASSTRMFINRIKDPFPLDLDVRSFISPYNKEKTLDIKFSDIMKNKNKTLEQLATVLGKMPSHIPAFYQNYIDANKRVLENNAPWISYLD